MLLVTTWKRPWNIIVNGGKLRIMVRRLLGEGRILK
jgi:hypothetical protein